MEFEALLNTIKTNFPEAVKASNTEVKQPYILVETEHLPQVAQLLFEDKELYFDHLSSISGVDYSVEKGIMQVIYHLYSIPFNHSIVLKVEFTRPEPNELASVPTVSHIWNGANWHEREAFDLFGINFTGHPDMRRILLPENWEGFPLRKDYKEQEKYHGIQVKY